MPPTWIGNVDIRGCRLERLEQRHQVPGTNFRADDEVGLDGNRHTRYRQRAQKPAVIGVHRSVDAYRAVAARGIPKGPHAFLRRILVTEAGMPGELLGFLGDTVALEIRGRCATDQTRYSDLAADMVLTADLADPQRGIEAFVDQVHRAVG